MQGFQGYGYSKKFVKNMTAVITELTANQDTEIEIVCESDIICSQCPFDKDNKCAMTANANEHMRNRDSAIIDTLGLIPNARMKIKDVQDLIEKKINTPEITQKLCGTCLWKKKCLWFVRQTKNSKQRFNIRSFWARSILVLVNLNNKIRNVRD